MQLEGKTILLTGCSGGIGSETGRWIIERGATLVATDAGCGAAPGQLACLRATSSDTLVDSWATVTPGPFGSLPLASVHIDGYALDEMPVVMLGEAKFSP